MWLVGECIGEALDFCIAETIIPVVVYLRLAEHSNIYYSDLN
jgi:hypothetical protein